MKTLEYHYGGNWFDRLLNAWPLCLDADSIGTAAVAWDKEGVYCPDDLSLFYNAAINAAFADPAQRTVIKRLARLAIHAARGRRLR